MNKAVELPPISAELAITTHLLCALRDAQGQRWCMDDLVGSMRRALGHTLSEGDDVTVQQSRVMLKNLCAVCPHPCRMKSW